MNYYFLDTNNNKLLGPYDYQLLIEKEHSTKDFKIWGVEENKVFANVKMIQPFNRNNFTLYLIILIFSALYTLLFSYFSFQVNLSNFNLSYWLITVLYVVVFFYCFINGKVYNSKNWIGKAIISLILPFVFLPFYFFYAKRKDI